jgi:UDP-N-acetylglucosamine diphosphorylase / glucose-1-phosphate thymidylyltransferase / UDP-N-acetylgalactosamine diphosphorylase / glucosamine-1-phosphate N-acetyltransferase / galactosamine-1-phosphate N-acetyltransferase
MTQWYIKDEHQLSLSPLSDLRASFEQRTGGLTTLERLTKKIGCAPSGFLCDDTLRANMISSRIGLQHVANETAEHCEHPDIATPWDILQNLPHLLAEDLEQSEVLSGEVRIEMTGKNRIDVHETATLYPGVVLDATAGAIRIEEGATIRSNAVLCGPCWIGIHCTVTEGALIKSNTVLGPHCKVGGEVGGTVFQGYANKSHEGHLGDSVIGEWVNIGAGTTNSNLLNTYGDVIVTDLDAKRHRTKRQFVGCFIGDHAKFAICSTIMTGTIIGTGAMVATSAYTPSPTKRFAWITDAGERTYQIDKFLTVAKTVMARRDVELDKATEETLRSLAKK